MNIPFEKLNYTFTRKPILVGGMAMEYYGLRKSGSDIDLIADEADVIQLIRMYPERVKDLYSDLGVCPFEFEIWRTICMLDYNTLKENAIDAGNVLVVSIQNLLLMKVLAMKVEKYMQDTRLIAEKLNRDLYQDYETEKGKVQAILRQMERVVYIEKRP